MHLDGESTTEVPLLWRKRLLRRSFQFDDPLRYTTHRVSDGEAAFAAACRRGDEGVDRQTGRRPLCRQALIELAEVQVQPRPGVRHRRLHRPEGSRVGLGALLLGYYDGDALRLRRQGRHGLRHRDAAQPARAVVRHRARSPDPSTEPRARRALGAARPPLRRWRSASGPATASCATRAISACAPTRTPTTSSGRVADVRRQVEITHADRVLFPSDGITKGRPRRLLHARSPRRSCRT